METDKAVVEVPSPVNGTVTELHASEGETVAVGEVIVTFTEEGESVTEEGLSATGASEKDSEAIDSVEGAPT